MCGLTVSFGNNLSSRQHVLMMNDLDHRGPDASKKLIVNKNLIFGHNRLKIIDLSNAANQPMIFDDCYIIFNGMIYNYLELKKELNNFFQFKTKSDTEVILASYLKWGSKCFEKLDGMFSIIIWNNKSKELVVSRDRLGIKPLYYRILDKKLFISSEIKPLLRLDSYEINDEVISKYFKYSLYEFGKNTFFKNINQFLPGYTYKIRKDLKFSKKKYWCLYNIIKRQQSEKKILDINHAKELVNVELERIIKIYSRSDTKIGLLYSSGLDSNALLNLINKNRQNINLLLSFGFIARGLPDELKSMKKNNLGHYKHRFTTKELLRNLNKVQIEQEMPWGGPNVFFLGNILKHSKKIKHDVVLSADGSDEIFGGYKKYLFSLNNNGKIDLNYITRAIDNTAPHNADLFQDRYLNKFKYDEKIDCPSENYLDNARYIDITLSKLPRNFRFSDRYSMGKSIELRYPFLDHKLIELSFKFSDKLMINNNKNKILLRKFYDDKSIKKHINGPQTSWLYSEIFRNYIIKSLKKSPIYDFYLDNNKVKSFVSNFYSRRVSNSFKLWQILNYDLWLRNFFN